MSFPNTLTIFINTRIRGYPKIKYEPDMSVPKIKSETVYFNPLVKLNKRVSLRIPPGYPETERLTQFFNKSDFNGLVGRNISSGFQKKYTLEEATKNGIVDNNINVTLDILFKKYNKFYIKGKPYTIFSHEWINGDWQIDKKSFERQIMQSTYGQGLYGSQQFLSRMADDELQKFKKEHGDILSGFASSSDISKFKDEYASGLARGIVPLKPTSNLTPDEEASRKLAEEEAKKTTPSSALSLIGKKLTPQQQPIINLDDEASLSNDPVSLNIIYSIDRNYSEDIKLNRKTLEPAYQQLLQKGEEYKRAKEMYDNSIGTYFALINEAKKTTPVATPVVTVGGAKSTTVPVAQVLNPLLTTIPTNDVFKNKTSYDETVENLNKTIAELKARGLTSQSIVNNPDVKNQMREIITSLEKYKIQFLNSFLSSLKLLIKKTQALINYIRALYWFYSNLYVTKEAHFKSQNTDKQYQNILILNIIKFDVQCYKNIINNFESAEPNPLADNFKMLIKEVSIVERFVALNSTTPKNYVELLEQYYEHPGLLLVNRYNYDVYMFSLLKFDFIIDLGIWKNLYRQTDLFLNSIKENIVGANKGGETIEGKLSIAKELLDKYNETYTEAQRTSFEQDVSKLNKPLQKQNAQMVDFAFPKTAALKQQQNDYIKLQTAITMCYDLITLYSRISAIKYSREISLITSRQNLCSVLSKIYTRKIKSYQQILADMAMRQFIPNYLFWDSQSYVDDATLRNTIAVTIKAKQENKTKHTSYKLLMKTLNKKYHGAIDLLIPEISKMGILSKCTDIVNDNDDDDHSDTDSIYDDDENEALTPGDKLKLSIEKNMERYFDEDYTETLREHIVDLYDSALRDNCIFKRLDDAVIENMAFYWNVTNNPGGGDCLFYAISQLFNAELVNNGRKSNNPFAEPTGYFSHKSLRRAIADPTHGLQFDDTDGWNNALRPQIEHVDMDDERADPDARQMRRENSFLFDDAGNWIGDNIVALRNAMRTGTRYWGDNIAINILERIFKVKFIIIDTSEIPLGASIPIGLDVTFINHSRSRSFGVIKTFAHDQATNEYVYEIEDVDFMTHQNIRVRQNQLTPSQQMPFRIAPTANDPARANEYSQFAFLLLTTESATGAAHYEIMHSNLDNKFIYTFQEMPDYLKYFIFKMQWKFFPGRDASWFGINNATRDYFNLLQQRYEQVRDNAPQRLQNIANGVDPALASIAIGPRRGMAGGEGQIGGQISNKNRYVNVYNDNAPRMDDSKLSYYIIVDLELYPGESIPLIKQPVIACNLRYEKIRQSFADMFGLAYHPLEFYKRDHVAPSSVKYRKEGESREDEYRPRFNNINTYGRPVDTRRFHVSYAGGKKTRRLR
jgi:hypothetical protein